MLQDEERKRGQQNKKQKKSAPKHQFACFAIFFFPSHLISALATCLQSE
jgi:hypothetical protein